MHRPPSPHLYEVRRLEAPEGLHGLPKAGLPGSQQGRDRDGARRTEDVLGQQYPHRPQVLAQQVGKSVGLLQISTRHPTGYLHHQRHEAGYRQLRKLTKTKGAFPNENNLLKLLYVTIQNASTKWIMPI